MDMSQVQALFGEFLANLRPDSIGDILVYLIFFLSLIGTFVLPDGNDRAQNLLYGTIVLCIFDLIVGQEWFLTGGNGAEAFVSYMARVAMFLAPFIAAGSARVKGKKGRAAMPIAALTGIIAMFYALSAFVVPDLMFDPIF